jgi:hypothetical protein
MSNQAQGSKPLEVRVRDLFATAHLTDDLCVQIVTKHKSMERIELLTFQVASPRYLNRQYLLEVLNKSRELRQTDPILVRKVVNSRLGTTLSAHILQSQMIFLQENDQALRTATRYKQLTYWGEASAAKLIAEWDGISVRTVHDRLFQARKRGLLAYPGTGKRVT